MRNMQKSKDHEVYSNRKPVILGRVTGAEMSSIPTTDEKHMQLCQRLQKLFESECSGRYEQMEVKCNIKEDLLRKIFKGKRKVQREVLAKLVVGLKINRRIVDELYDLMGHPLNTQDRLDKITIQALRDKDDIYTFIEEVDKYTKNAEGTAVIGR